MKWLAIGSVAALGLLWWQGGASTSDPLGAISLGWARLSGPIGIGAATVKPAGATTAGAAPQPVSVGGG